MCFYLCYQFVSVSICVICFDLFLSVSICFCLFLSVFICFCLFLSVLSVFFCFYLFYLFLSVLSVFICFICFYLFLKCGEIICTIYGVLSHFRIFCCIIIFCDFCCFVAKSVLVRFTLFYVEKN